MTEPKSMAIRRLNDKLRTRHIGGRVVLTVGVSALGLINIARIIKEIAEFKDFNSDNDPLGEHNFAIIEIDEDRYIWKIDYYDESLTRLSEDPDDPNLTVRVLTVMQASEY